MFDEFWNEYFDRRNTVSFEDFVSSLSMYFNDDLELPLYTTVNSHAEAVKNKLEKTDRSIPAEVAQGCEMNETPMFVNALLHLWLGWFDSEQNLPHDEPREIARHEFWSFVKCFGGDLNTAFLIAQVSMFDENGALFPWIHSHSATVPAEAEGFRIRFSADETEFIVAEEFTCGKRAALWHLRFEREKKKDITSPLKWFCTKGGDRSGGQPSRSVCPTLSEFVKEEFLAQGRKALALPAVLDPLSIATVKDSHWLTRLVFNSVSVNDRLAVEIAMNSRDLYEFRDEFGLTCVHVACAFNRTQILEMFKPKVPMEILVAATVKEITPSDGPELSQFTVENRAMPYFRTLLRLREGSPCGSVACSYQSQASLMMISEWLAEKNILLTHPK